MPSFFDLQKFAATGIASADMSAFDKARALAAFGGGKTRTLTDVPPLSFPSNGSPITIWSMLGNTQQTGTPSPQSIIMPTFCGVRTGNLFDASNTLNNARIGAEGKIVNDNSCVLSDYISVLPNESYSQSRSFTYSNSLAEFDGNKEFIKRYVSGNGKITTSENTRFIRVSCTKTIVDSFMLNLGTTALPYEPFGWSEKITCGGQTNTVYLGEVQTVRRIKKLVLTGTESWYRNDVVSRENTSYFYTTKIANNAGNVGGYCTHFVYDSGSYGHDYEGFSVLSGYGALRIRISNSIASTVTDLKAWLTDQYAAGTPVCVWYVIAEPETGIVNEPLAKIGDYADELHSEDTTASIPTAKGQNTLTVDTELQPSEMTITYNE